MAKSKSRTSTTPTKPSPASTDSQALLSSASTLLQQGRPDEALAPAQKALSLSPSSTSSLPALTLLAEIHLELGDAPSAKDLLTRAISLDPDGLVPEAQGGGADKFLYMSQLCEEGGEESVSWFEKGVVVLEREIRALEERGSLDPALGLELLEKKKKLAHTLCGIVEIYMTDLSFSPDAEAQCEALISRALLTLPTPDASTLQTLASIRLSQSRIDDAQSALERSLELWRDLPVEDEDVPDFATRISLARLLMEADMCEDALEVCERLVSEDDESVEAWYLGGWCLWLMGQELDGDGGEADGQDEGADGQGGGADGVKIEDEAGLEGALDKGATSNGTGTAKQEDTDTHMAEEDEEEEEALAPMTSAELAAAQSALQLSSREWLRNCLALYKALEYEDERLGEHATELVGLLDEKLGGREIEEDGGEEEGEEGWESEDDEEDEEMVDA